MRLLCASVWVFALGGTASAQRKIDRASPDLVITHAKIFTADPTRPWAEAIAVRGTRITAVGSNAEIAALAGRASRRIDAGGRTMIPGINDAHDHAGGAAFGTSFETSAAGMTNDYAEILDSVRMLAHRARAGTWISTQVGARVFENVNARRASLDSAAPAHPVMLTSRTGHQVIVNTAALRLLHVGETDRAPAGGYYERDAGGRLTGLLNEYALWNSTRTMNSSMSESVLVSAMRQYAATGLRFGITSVQDMANDLDPATTLRILRAAQPPERLRVIGFPMTTVSGRLAAEWDHADRNPTPLTVVSGRKWILDGTPVEQSAVMRVPYDRPDASHGHLDFPPDTIRAILRDALRTHEQLMLHISGDSTAALVLHLMESLAPDSVWRPLRLRFEHGDGLMPDLIPIAKRLGVIVVQNPTHFGAASGSPNPADRVGFAPLKSLLRAGVPIALGSDGARNPYLNIMLATARAGAPSEAVTREEAVSAYTRGSAYAEFAEKQKGTLSPGMLADLAMLSQDIFTIPSDQLPRTVSVLTIVGGRIVYSSGKIAN